MRSSSPWPLETETSKDWKPVLAAPRSSCEASCNTRVKNSIRNRTHLSSLLPRVSSQVHPLRSCKHPLHHPLCQARQLFPTQRPLDTLMPQAHQPARKQHPHQHQSPLHTTSCKTCTRWSPAQQQSYGSSRLRCSSSSQKHRPHQQRSRHSCRTRRCSGTWHRLRWQCCSSRRSRRRRAARSARSCTSR